MVRTGQHIEMDMDIQEIKRRVKEVDELRRREHVRHIRRRGTRILRHNSALLAKTPEPSHQAKLLWLYGMPAALHKKWFGELGPNKDLTFKALRQERTS